MKLTLIIAVLFTGMTAFSAGSPKAFSFQFKGPKSFSITQKASSKEEAYKLAAKECYKKLTDNRYPGEEKGLEIIDICANPKM